MAKISRNDPRSGDAVFFDMKMPIDRFALKFMRP
jgi:hypothetical protein